MITIVEKKWERKKPLPSPVLLCGICLFSLPLCPETHIRSSSSSKAKVATAPYSFPIVPTQFLDWQMGRKNLTTYININKLILTINLTSVKCFIVHGVSCCTYLNAHSQAELLSPFQRQKNRSLSGFRFQSSFSNSQSSILLCHGCLCWETFITRGIRFLVL